MPVEKGCGSSLAGRPGEDPQPQIMVAVMCCIIAAGMEKFRIHCPCCEATITIDAQTGAILSHEEKKKVTGSFEDLKGQLSKQAELRDQLFAQEMSSQKDRERLLEEKFKEAMKNADKDSGQPFRNPLDLD